ncbi:DUF4282 domain-containing protein [bacterium]|nr:DUF4282 domain-containing protein [bacterium]MCI0603187.1 DUF4282 domain-containing protein [bacterium]
MAETRWYLSVDGQQEGDFSLEDVRARIEKNRGRRVLVWTQGMAQWADPAELPQFKAAPAPAPAPAPAYVPPAHSPGPAAVIEQPISTKIDKDEIKKQAGILKSLLDFRFESFITGKIIPVIYIILVVVIALSVVGVIFVTGFGGLISAIKLESFTLAITALGTIILAPLVGVLYIALVRIWFEFLIIIFRIKQDLTTLLERSEKKSKES